MRRASPRVTRVGGVELAVEMTQAEVAERLGRTTRAVRMAEASAFRKMRTEIERHPERYPLLSSMWGDRPRTRRVED